jgi:mitochondrial intermediate peptidase
VNNFNRSFSIPSFSVSEQKNLSNVSGVMGVPFLSSPSSFNRAADIAIQVCDPLIKSIATLPNNVTKPPEPIKVLRTLDTISDTICKVLDAAECVRNVHSNSEWRDNADATFHSLSSYMFQLNAFVPLFQSLKSVTDDPVAMKGLTPEQVRMALMLRREFERDGIHLDEASREEIVRLNELIGQISSQFLANISEASSKASLSDVFASDIASISGRISRIAEDPIAVAEVLKHAPQASFRQLVMKKTAEKASSSQNITLLHQLRDARNRLASRIGFSSYADLVASDRMAGSPTNAIHFLQSLSRALRPRIVSELKALQASKISHASLNKSEVALDATFFQNSIPEQDLELKPWDVSYYTNRSIKDSFNGDAHTMASEYLPLSAVISGLQGIMRKVFGVTMVSVDLQPGESWVATTSSSSSSQPQSPISPLPLKFILRHDQEGALGTMYLDLFSRPGKFPGAAHFVVRCGKHIHEIDGGFEKAIGVTTTQVPSSGGSLGQSFQLPIVTLVTNYANPLPVNSSESVEDTSNSVAKSLSASATHSVLMTPHEVETLFHEFGHAIHSLFSRTEFQHLSGTRGALDFVELPSHLMEYFARDLRVVKSFAKHHITHAPIPDALWNQVQDSRKAFSGIDLMQSINLSLFDQALFGSPSSVDKILNEEEIPNNIKNNDTSNRERLVSGVSLTPDELLIPMTPSSDSNFFINQNPPNPIPNVLVTNSKQLDSSELLDAVHKRYSPVPNFEKSMFQATFAHAATYGAGYYTYVYATALSAAVWKKLFAKDPFDRKAGDLLRNEILSKGAGADPCEMITKVLGEKATMIALLEELNLLKEEKKEE